MSNHHLQAEQPYLGELGTMVINHLLTGALQISQVFNKNVSSFRGVYFFDACQTCNYPPDLLCSSQYRKIGCDLNNKKSPSSSPRLCHRRLGREYSDGTLSVEGIGFAKSRPKCHLFKVPFGCFFQNPIGSMHGLVGG